MTTSLQLARWALQDTILCCDLFELCQSVCDCCSAGAVCHAASVKNLEVSQPPCNELSDQTVPKLLEVCKEWLTELVTISVGAVSGVITAACEQIPWHGWNYDTVDVFLGCQNRPHTLNSFFEDIRRTDKKTSASSSILILSVHNATVQTINIQC
jgi:hypothetical protein